MDFFTQAAQKMAPLADRMRPTTLSEFIGQEHIVGPGKLLRRAIAADALTSCIFYGPPGCGKTTLASIIANHTSAAFVKLNAVTSGVADVRKVIEDAEARLRLDGRHTYLLLDECHRWSKAQSDALLPAMEKGTIRFIGSTTENPMIAMTPAIVSRCRVFEFRALQSADVALAVQRALTDEKNGLGFMKIDMPDSVVRQLADMSNGDVRVALTALELAALSTDADGTGVVHIDAQAICESMQQRVMPMDDSLYYDMLSAFCKSLRGSDSTAALGWAARLLYAGCDPHLILRRVMAHASEDVGLADPMAMVQAVSAMQALNLMGMPEARLPMAQAIIYVCEAPKSNAVVMAIDEADADARNMRHENVPEALRDTHYAGADKLGRGRGYLYPHDFPGHYVTQNYRPAGLEKKEYYRPGTLGFEAEILQRKKAREAIDRQQGVAGRAQVKTEPKT